MIETKQQHDRALWRGCGGSTFTILVSLPVNQVGVLDSGTAFMHGVAVCSCDNEACQVLKRALWLAKEAFALPESRGQPLGCCSQLQT